MATEALATENITLGTQLHAQLAAADDDETDQHTQIDEARTALRATIDHIEHGAD
ncbi:MAG: hypothetical protein WAX14_19230 [Rhodococcus sp. (in: high G+C Gram-positive bacteria)]|uniref:hypothetical protein n=1 Tax=Rhodococcus sp. TaxID=1831 RepID=UPI003BB5E771